MRIVFFGDSITDMEHKREEDLTVFSYGDGYPFFIEGELSTKFPKKFEIYNRGISGDKITALYARERGIWNLKPDVFSVLVGVNDVFHKLWNGDTEPEIFDRTYRWIIRDVKKHCPDVHVILMEPFLLPGTLIGDSYEEMFPKVRELAAIVKRVAEEEGCGFVPLQEPFEKAAERVSADHWLYDGIHPSVAGAKMISDQWLAYFYEAGLHN